MWFVYIIESSKGKWYYVGSTNDIKRRLKQHNAGLVTSIKSHIPLNLVYRKEFKEEIEARSFEKRIKQQRRLKEEIIRNI